MPEPLSTIKFSTFFHPKEVAGGMMSLGDQLPKKTRLKIELGRKGFVGLHELLFTEQYAYGKMELRLIWDYFSPFRTALDQIIQVVKFGFFLEFQEAFSLFLMDELSDPFFRSKGV